MITAIEIAKKYQCIHRDYTRRDVHMLVRRVHDDVQEATKRKRKRKRKTEVLARCVNQWVHRATKRTRK